MCRNTFYIFFYFVHTGEKSFFQVGDQMKHLMTHINGDSNVAKSESTDETITPDPLVQPQTFACDKCDKVYTKRSHLKRHYTIHSSQKPFKCEVCGQGFSRLEHLKRHSTIHSNIKRYECEFCDKKFNRPDHMLCHIKTHRNVKPYKCNQCGDRFETSKEKIEHLRTHSGAYRCEMCYVRFEKYVNLIEHRRVVHGIIPKNELEGRVNTMVKSTDQYACPICYVMFEVINLSDHIRTHISDDENSELMTNVKVKVEMEYNDEYDECAAVPDSMLEQEFVEEDEQLNGYEESDDYMDMDNGLVDEPIDITQHDNDADDRSS